MKVKPCVYMQWVYPLLDLFSMLKQVIMNTCYHNTLAEFKLFTPQLFPVQQKPRSCTGCALMRGFMHCILQKKTSLLPCLSEIILTSRPACPGTSPSKRPSPQLSGRGTAAGGSCWELYFLSHHGVFSQLAVLRRCQDTVMRLMISGCN